MVTKEVRITIVYLLITLTQKKRALFDSSNTTLARKSTTAKLIQISNYLKYKNLKKQNLKLWKFLLFKYLLPFLPHQVRVCWLFDQVLNYISNFYRIPPAFAWPQGSTIIVLVSLLQQELNLYLPSAEFTTGQGGRKKGIFFAKTVSEICLFTVFLRTGGGIKFVQVPCFPFNKV